MNIELHLERQEAIACLVEDSDWQQWFKLWQNCLTPKEMEAGDYEVSLRLTDDAEIQSLNAQYRQQDRPTDVLAFAALENDIPRLAADFEQEAIYLGDIIISVPQAIAQAQEAEHSAQRELVWLAAHGFLHLLGWDHLDPESLAEMLQQQEILINSWRS